MKTIVLKDRIGTFLQTRKSAKELLKLIETDSTLDFIDVTFMTRSFADEICCILDHNPNVKVINMDTAVRTLFDIVKESRLKPRENHISDSEVLTFNDVESFLAYLNTI